MFCLCFVSANSTVGIPVFSAKNKFSSGPTHNTSLKRLLSDAKETKDTVTATWVVVLGGEGNSHGTYKFCSSPSPWGGSVPSKADRVTLTVRVAVEDYVVFTSCEVSSKPEVTYKKMSHKNIIQLESTSSDFLWTATSDDIRQDIKSSVAVTQNPLTSVRRNKCPVRKSCK